MKSILIADDSASMRQMVEFTLRGAGYNVTSCPDGEAASQTAQGQAFDMVLTDLNMPGKNGIELIRSIRGSGPNATKPIIMLTTESDPEKKQQGKAAGATGWIVKPFDGDKLIAVVKKVLR
ncbi:MAG: response regulator [Opitutales bacterium]